MNRATRTNLRRAGWAVGSAADFLGLSREEQQFLELRLALAAGVKALREKRGLTQTELARQLRSSQSRVAKIEAADRSVSVDLIMRSLLAVGATASQIAKLIKNAESHRAA